MGTPAGDMIRIDPCQQMFRVASLVIFAFGAVPRRSGEFIENILLVLIFEISALRQSVRGEANTIEAAKRITVRDDPSLHALDHEVYPFSTLTGQRPLISDGQMLSSCRCVTDRSGQRAFRIYEQHVDRLRFRRIRVLKSQKSSLTTATQDETEADAFSAGLVLQISEQGIKAAAKFRLLCDGVTSPLDIDGYGLHGLPPSSPRRQISPRR